MSTQSVTVKEHMAAGHRAAEALWRGHRKWCGRCQKQQRCGTERTLYAAAERAEQRARDAGVEL